MSSVIKLVTPELSDTILNAQYAVIDNAIVNEMKKAQPDMGYVTKLRSVLDQHRDEIARRSFKTIVTTETGKILSDTTVLKDGVSFVKSQLIGLNVPVARKIRVYPSLDVAPYAQFLEMSQLQVFDPNGVNLAMNKPTFATSTATSQTIDRKDIVVDGQRVEPTMDAGKYWSLGDSGVGMENEYWEVDLGADYSVQTIVYVGVPRAGADSELYKNKNKGVNIKLINSVGVVVSELLTPSTDIKQTLTPLKGVTVVLPTLPTVRKVRVRPSILKDIDERVRLSISQLKVIDTTGANVAVNKTVFATSTLPGFNKNAPVDGLRNQAVSGEQPTLMWHIGENSKIQNYAAEFWEVDLGQDYTLKEVVYMSRVEDGFKIRNKGIDIELLNSVGAVVIDMVTPTEDSVQTLKVPMRRYKAVDPPALPRDQQGNAMTAADTYICTGVTSDLVRYRAYNTAIGSDQYIVGTVLGGEDRAYNANKCIRLTNGMAISGLKDANGKDMIFGETYHFWNNATFTGSGPLTGIAQAPDANGNGVVQFRRTSDGTDGICFSTQSVINRTGTITNLKDSTGSKMFIGQTYMVGGGAAPKQLVLKDWLSTPNDVWGGPSTFIAGDDLACASKPVARYVVAHPSLTATDGGYFAFSQIKVFDKTGVNVAKGKTVTTNCTLEFGAYNPSVVVDDLTSTPRTTDAGMWIGGKVVLSGTTPVAAPADLNNAFFSIDLGQEFEISKLLFVGRGGAEDKFDERNAGIRFELRDANNIVTRTLVTPSAAKVQELLVPAAATGCVAPKTNAADCVAAAGEYAPLASKVRIRPSTTGSAYLSIGQIQVFTPDMQGIAVKKPVTASSTDRIYSAAPSWIVDGLRDSAPPAPAPARSGWVPTITDAAGNLIAHDLVRNEYIEIDLQGTFPISFINYVGNVADARNNGVRIELLDAGGNVIAQDKTKTEATVQSIIFRFKPGAVLSQTETLTFQPVARRVRIRPSLIGSAYLAIAQMQVITSQNTNVSLRKPVYATSTDANESKPPSWITDGLRDKPTGQWGDAWVPIVWGANGLLPMDPIRANEYAEIDLQGIFPISTINYIGATSTNDSRNNGVRIELLNEFGQVIFTKNTTTENPIQTLSFSLPSGSPGLHNAIPAVPVGCPAASNCTPLNFMPVTRKVRIRPGLDPVLAITQIIIRNPAGENIAKGKPVTATSSSPGNEAQLPKIVDGLKTAPSSDPTQFWHVGVHNDRDGQYVEIDLQGEFPVKDVVYIGREIPGYETRHLDVRFEFIDSDGQIIGQAATQQRRPMQTLMPTPIGCSVYTNCLPMSFMPPVRRVRIKPGLEAATGISQIVIKNAAGTNIAQGKPVTATSTWSGASAASVMVDGARTAPTSTTTGFWRFNASNRTGHSVDIDLQTDSSIQEVIYVGRDLPANPNRHNDIQFEFYNSAGRLVGRTATRGSAAVQSMTSVESGEAAPPAAQAGGFRARQLAVAVGKPASKYRRSTVKQKRMGRKGTVKK